jgi:hypothetical protein
MTIVLFVLNTMVMKKETQGQTIQWSGEKKQKEGQYNCHEKRDKRTDNTMDIRKEKKGQTIQWSCLLLFLFS